MVPASSADGRIVRFGVFELDTSSGELRRDVARVPLQQQPLTILLRLLECPGQVVTRDELRNELWPDASFGDFEHGLNAAIKRLRDALGDSADAPRFVETLPKRGYRFIAPVVAAAASGDESAPPSSIPPRSTRIARRIVLAGFAILILGALVFAARHLRRPAAQPITGLTILVADFVNRTGDAVFDGTLKQALRAEIEQSPGFQLISGERVGQTLKQMMQLPGTPVVGDVALEVCQRTGSNVILRGSIVQIGRSYAINIEAVNCETKASIAEQHASASDREQVLDIVGRSGARLRRDLGESAGSLQRFSVPISEATTTSLEALKAFSIAEQIRDERGDVAAEPYYVEAIALDREFALAYARLAAIYVNTGRREQRDRMIAEAYARRDHVSERERLYIDARQCETSLPDADPEKCFPFWETWKRTYPLDWRPYQSLCVGDNRIGNYSRALPNCTDAVRLGPEHWLTYTNLVTTLLALDRVADAKRATDAALARGIDAPNIRQDRFLIAMASGDREGMAAERRAVRGMPEEFIVVTYEATAAAIDGRIEEARRLDAEAVQLTNGRFADFTADVEAGQALLAAAVGYQRCTGWPRLSRDTPATSAWLTAMLLCGDDRAARDLLPALRPARPIVEPARTLIAVRAGDRDAVRGMAPLTAVAFTRTGVELRYLRGLAYLRAGDGHAAAAEFQNIVDHRGVHVFSPLYPLAHVQAARAHRMTGDLAKARTAYESFFKMWEHADSDVPILIAAKSEYASLAAQR